MGAGVAIILTANVALLHAGIPAALWSDLKAAGLIKPDAPVPAGPLR